MNIIPTSGRIFTAGEVRSSSHVVLLGPKTAKELFGSRSPLGEKIKIENKSFDVIGVLEEKSPDYDQQILMPYTTMKDEPGFKDITNIKTLVNSSFIDFNVLTNPEFYDKEIAILKKEIAEMSKGDEASKKIAQDKKAKLDAIVKWKKAMESKGFEPQISVTVTDPVTKKKTKQNQVNQQEALPPLVPDDVRRRYLRRRCRTM